ncbi:MAG TPA: DHHA1 domain-containing protein [Gemmatimonadaceae bacterium]|nr:DHHA1 domain-containing protein [Gemmatimonadaceae bacterium]
MTERLYYTDAYLRSFDARIVDRASDGRTVYLDRTAFYPTSGGQPFDTGTLAGIAVTDVVDEGDRIAHVLASPASTIETVHGEIDWTRRFDHMQQHTGQHLLSAIFADTYKLETVSVHFGAESSTLDLDTESLAQNTLLAAERLANIAVAEPRAVTVSFEDAATATGLRKPPPREGELRVVSIDALDRSACGGTHVRSTAEIGAILLRRTERVRKATRVEFICGLRAVRAARTDYELISALALSLGVAPVELIAKTQSQGEELRAAQAARREAASQLDGYRARELYDATPPDMAGHRRVVVHRDAGSVDELRSLAQAVVGIGHARFIGTLETPPTIVFATSNSPGGVDAGAVLKTQLAHHGGRGGGNARIAQGTVPTREALDAVVAAL